jgi:TolB-like protein/class 3 adenylate cyclase/Tfp pilus assembly protein PilF
MDNPIERESRKLVAIMFTDMVGYSALTQKNEQRALELLEEHRRLLRPLFARHEGHEIETAGDAFFVEFASALSAARCAVEIQERLFERNQSASPEDAIRLRIGLHLGDVVYKGNYVHGDGVNIAARVQPLAPAGGVCLSEDVARQIENKIDRPVVKLGKGELKNIQLPVRIYRIIMPWEKKSQNWPERLSFAFRKKRTRKYSLIGLAFVLLAGMYLVFAPKTTHADRKSVAVLPFKNLSDSKEDEYFSDGITEDIITRLSKIRDLKVISRTSVMRYKTSDKAIPEICQELKVATALEGSVRRSGDRLRIVSQLIDAQSDEHLWAESYDRKMQDIFEIQSDVAQRIATALEAKLVPSEKVQLARQGTDNLQAYSLYLKGRYFWNKRTPENVQKGIEFFERAILEDASYAMAYAGLADAYSALGSIEYGSLSPKETVPKAKSAAETALRLDPDLAEAIVALANIKFTYEWNWPEAERLYKRVIETNPGYAPAHHMYSHLLCATGRLDEAMAEDQRSLELDPLSLIINTQVGMTLYYARRYDQAIQQHRKTVEMDPTFLQARLALGLAYERSGNVDAAIGEFQTALAMVPELPVAQALLAYAYAAAGKRSETFKILEVLQQPEIRQFVSPFHMAVVYLGLDNKEQVFTWLDKACEEHSSYLVYLKVEPLADKLRSDPRFIAIMEKVGLEEQR